MCTKLRNYMKTDEKRRTDGSRRTGEETQKQEGDEGGEVSRR